MWKWVVVVSMAAACGRISYDPVAADGDASTDASTATADAQVFDASGIDAEVMPTGCPPSYGVVDALPDRYKVGPSPQTWAVARDMCRLEGGYLVIVDSPAEALSMINATGLDSWSGITDQAMEGQWITIFGDPAPLLDWNTGQPSNDTTFNPEGQDCGRLHEAMGKLDDDYCDVMNPYVCECTP